MREYTVKNLTETKKIATQLAKELVGGELLALTGNLGAGKTAFIQALAKTLGVKENITSPTFVLMKVYDIKYRKAKVINMHHIGHFNVFCNYHKLNNRLLLNNKLRLQLFEQFRNNKNRSGFGIAFMACSVNKVKAIH